MASWTDTRPYCIRRLSVDGLVMERRTARNGMGFEPFDSYMMVEGGKRHMMRSYTHKQALTLFVRRIAMRGLYGRRVS